MNPAEVAKKYIGERETPNNSGFIDKEFQEKIEACGWVKGQAWCAYFCELVWKESYPGREELNSLFQAGAVANLTSFRKNQNYIVDKKPEIGALIVWQNYKEFEPQWTGHIGIVENFDDLNIYTIEGNTNSQGGREGIEVTKKIRGYDFLPKKNGLVLKGFIKPKL